MPSPRQQQAGASGRRRLILRINKSRFLRYYFIAAGERRRYWRNLSRLGSVTYIIISTCSRSGVGWGWDSFIPKIQQIGLMGGWWPSAGSGLGLILLSIHPDGGSEPTLARGGTMQSPPPLRGPSAPPHVKYTARKVVFLHPNLCVCLLLLLSSADLLTRRPTEVKVHTYRS